METLQEYMDSFVRFSWEDKTIRIMRNDGNKRKPYLTCLGAKEVPKDLLRREILAVVHLKHDVFEFWLKEK